MMSDASDDLSTNRRPCSNFIRSRVVTTAALFLFVGLLGACSTSEPPAPAPGAVAGVTADKIIEHPNAYVGKTVTVSGDVEGIFGPRAFEIDDGLNVGTLLVLGREPFPQVPDAGNRAYVIDDTATVTGVVRMMVVADIEREIGWDLESHIEAEYTAKPVLLAQQVGFRPGTNRRAATIGTPMANTSDNMAMQTRGT